MQPSKGGKLVSHDSFDFCAVAFVRVDEREGAKQGAEQMQVGFRDQLGSKDNVVSFKKSLILEKAKIATVDPFYKSV